MRITRTPDGRAALLRALEHSGLSMAEFCRLHDLSYGTVAAWRSMARRAAGRFVEVETADIVNSGGGMPPAPGELCAELVLPSGAVLRIFQGAARGGAA
jgi:transposase-like protein